MPLLANNSSPMDIPVEEKTEKEQIIEMVDYLLKEHQERIKKRKQRKRESNTLGFVIVLRSVTSYCY